MRKTLSLLSFHTNKSPMSSFWGAPPHELRDMGLTVLDTGTLLQWVKDPSQFPRQSWDDALDYVENLEYGGYSDWRLPSGLNPDGTLCNSQPHGLDCPDTELGHLYFSHYNLEGQGRMDPFESFADNFYWTSTEFPNNTTKAMAQDFIDGGNVPWSKGATIRIWPVRKADAVWVYTPFIGWKLLFMITAAVVSWWIIRRLRRNINLPK